MSRRQPHPLELLISRIFTIIDGQIALSVKEGTPLPFYDLNEMIKLETEENMFPLHLSIKFEMATDDHDEECDIQGNHFGLLWMYTHRKRILKKKQNRADPLSMMELELFSLWQDDIMEMEGIDVNEIETIDIYTKIKGSREIIPLEF
jgi:hypothetical protein